LGLRFFVAPGAAARENGRAVAEKLIRADAVAELLDVDRYRVYELAREGNLPHVRLGRAVRFDPVAIREWIAQGGTARNGG
jgi:excisionase family DNA binding protein